MSDVTVTPTRSTGRFRTLSLLIIFAAILPVFVDYSLRMWSKGHYQFFPFILLFVAWHTWSQRATLEETRTEPRPAIVYAALGTLWLLLTFSHLLSTSFLGAIALLWAACTMTYVTWGSGGCKKLWPLLLVLLTVVPLPFLLDERLTVKMQHVASQLASYILDSIGEIHFRQGVILTGSKGSFLTEEACSGIRSLFSSIALVSVYSVTMQYKWPRVIFNLVQVTGWVIVGNAVRVAFVVWGVTHVSPAIGTGWIHDALGLGVLFLILGLALSTDAILNLRKTSEYGAGARYGITDYSSRDSRRRQQSRPNAGKPLRAGQRLHVPVIAFALISIAFLATFGLGLRRMQIRFGDSAFLIASAEELAPVSETALDQIAGKWTIASFDQIQRTPDNLLAERSYIWTTALSDGTVAAISLDDPYNSWHDLSICYGGLGWSCDLVQHYTDSTGDQSGYSELRLRKSSGETGVVLFSSMDRYGESIPPVLASGVFLWDSIREQATINLAASLGIGADSAAKLRGIPLPASQLQVTCFPTAPLTDKQETEMLNLFLSARDQLMKAPRYTEAAQ